jgi:hypothetical protein
MIVIMVIMIVIIIVIIIEAIFRVWGDFCSGVEESRVWLPRYDIETSNLYSLRVIDSLNDQKHIPG